MANRTANNPEDAVFTPCYHFSNISFGRERSPSPLIINCVLNACFSVVAIWGNVLVLHSVSKASSLHRPSKILLFSLAMSDLCVGLLVEPVYIIFLTSKIKSLPQTFCQSGIVLYLTSSTLNAVSMLTVVAISLDRYVAFHFHTNYRNIVTVKRVATLIVGIWLYSVFWGTSMLWSMKLYYLFALVNIAICIPVATIAYLRIYRGLRHREKEMDASCSQVTYQGRARTLSDVGRYRRSVTSSLWLYCVLLVCYLPYLCSSAVATATGLTPLMVPIIEFTSTLVFLNSSLNPFVYCWRIREIRAIMKETLELLQFWKPKNSRETWNPRKVDERQRKYIQDTLQVSGDAVSVLSCKTITTEI